jgi:hypothetical protein
VLEYIKGCNISKKLHSFHCYRMLKMFLLYSILILCKFKELEATQDDSFTCQSLSTSYKNNQIDFYPFKDCEFTSDFNTSDILCTAFAGTKPSQTFLSAGLFVSIF